MQQPVWNTVAGSLGNFPSATVFAYQLSATPQLPAVTLTYALISGSFPAGLTMNTAGLISGTPLLVTIDTTSTFVIRVTDNYGNIRDRTFSITMSGSAIPSFTTPGGTIATILDSTWTELPIEYNNPISTNPVTIRKISGILPPGIEINEYGLIRGYAAPPTTDVNLPSVVTFVVATTSVTNTLTCLSTADISPGRPVIFSGATFGSIVANQTYYVKTVLNGTQFTVAHTVNGSVVAMDDAVGYMVATLPNITVGEPINQSYSFTLKLESPLGSATQLYTISVINQNTPLNQGGPGYPPNTRIPTIYNTRPETYILDSNIAEYGYYVIPPNSHGNTYSPSQYAYIGSFTSNNIFNFQVLGHDFDGNQLTYTFSNLPLGLVGDSNTGWVTGNPIISDNSISQFSFSVYVSKVIHTNIVSDTFNFSFNITNNVSGNVTWITPANMGTVLNGITSIEYVQAVSDVPLQYRLTSGTLPPNLTLLPNGELSGIVSFQPTTTIQSPNTSTDFTFTVQAYSEQYPIVNSSQTFTLSVYQEFDRPVDTLYCKCTPSISDRNLLATLLNNDSLIPTDYLYRADDPFFGKATNIIYDHAYGIYANNLDAYVAAIQEKNHYWRNITLGEIKTAIARDENTGEILYEVVYSEIYDNLVNYNEVDNNYSNESQSNIITPQGESVAKEIYWPRAIPLFLGPWYDTETNIYTSYEGENSPPPTYYTSRTPGFARVLYPNSLPNMRQQVVDVLGQDYNYKLLPLWMTSQQLNGSTLGYTPAWVIAYCKPGTTTLNGQTVSYAEYIQYQIQNNWKNEVGEVQTLNTINFEIDRFTVNKSATYNFDNTLNPAAWTVLPSATPTPNPIDSKDFYVLFPRETILPDTTQYRQ